MTLILSVVVIASLAAYAAWRKASSKVAPRHQDADLVKVLLGLGEESLNELLELYGEQFGPNAARYARQTYRKWKAGEVRPNSRTFNRLLINLPKVMSFDLKCEVLRRLREEYCAKDNYQITVYTDNWKETLAPLAENIIERAYTAELPAHIGRRLRWLSDNEMHVARAILAESQVQESRNTVLLLEKEFVGIEQLLNAAKGTRNLAHTLKLPYGVVTLKIRRR
jgi:hypothetical protein